MAKFKIGKMKELKIEWKELESELESESKLELRLKEPIFRKIVLKCEMNNILISKSYYWKRKNSMK